ncbi:MAG TPA: MmgE/PrpD family protein [bacterium]|jgi:2-methylcitrate dehydratase
MTLSERLARYAAGFRYEDLPPDVVHAATQRLIDTLACALAGHAEDPARIAREVTGLLRPKGPATIIGTRGTSAPDLAAFSNGVAVRALDFNDTYLSLEALHPSDTIPALLAVAEAEGRNGKELLAAMVLSYEVACRLADASSIRDRGWDHTTYGVIPTALAAGYLMRLDPAGLAHAVNLAVASNVTLRQIRVGHLSMWKGAAFGNASRNGVFAAYLARFGMTGPAEVFEGPRGFFAQVSGPLDLALADPGGSYRIVDTLIKQYPAEYHAQAAIEAALALRKRAKGNAIEAVEVHTYKAAVQIIGGEPEKWYPATRETADHSLPYLTAVALLDGEVSRGSFAMERIMDPAVRAFLPRITVSEDLEHTSRYPRTLPVRMVVRTAGGHTLMEEVETPLGHPRRPMTDAQLERKFRACAVPPLSARRAKRLLARLWRIDTEDSLSDLLRLCTIPRR